MSTQTITVVLLLVALVVLLGWDVVVAFNARPGDTISEIVRDTARNNLMIPFAIGVVCGHWFWT